MDTLKMFSTAFTILSVALPLSATILGGIIVACRYELKAIELKAALGVSLEDDVKRLKEGS